MNLETVFGVCVVVGSTYLTPRESFALMLPRGTSSPQVVQFDSGKQKLGSVVIPALSKLPAPSSSSNDDAGVHILVLVHRAPEEESETAYHAFSVLDEDLAFMQEEESETAYHAFSVLDEDLAFMQEEEKGVRTRRRLVWHVTEPGEDSASTLPKWMKMMDGGRDDALCWMAWTRERLVVT